MSDLTAAERERMAELKGNIRREMERVNSKPRLKTTGEESLDALVNHVTGAFGWQEMNRSDDGDTVTLYNGRDFLDIGLTPAEVVDALKEQGLRHPICITAPPGSGAQCTCAYDCDNYWIRANGGIQQ